MVRRLVQYPRQRRVNSFPYLNSDTYSFLCDKTMYNQEDFAGIGSLPNE